MATTTTNLSLRKPETTDFVNVALDIAGNMQTIDEKWATSAAANIGSAAASGSALTVARTDHVHTVGSGTVSAPGLPIGESNSGFYRIGSANIGAAIAGALSWAWSAAGLALEAMLSLKHIATPSAPGAGYLGLYAKSDNNVYKQTPAGDEVRVLDADIFTAQGDIVYGTGAETFTQLAKGTARQALAMNSGATAPEWVASLQSLMTAQGDIPYASAANTPTVLVKGTAGQYLTMNSGATAPQWTTGGMVLLGSSTLGSSASTIDFTSIASTYTHLLLIVTARSTGAYTTDNLLMRVGNGSFDAGGNYDYQQTYSVSTTLTGSGAAAGTYWQIGQLPGSTAPSNVFSRATIWIPHYATSGMQREYISESTSRHGTAVTDFYRSACGGGWRSTSAIDRVRLLPGGGGASLEAGTVAQLYGVW